MSANPGRRARRILFGLGYGALAGWIAHIEGSHSGIVGLPLHETVRLLHEAGVATALASP